MARHISGRCGQDAVVRGDMLGDQVRLGDGADPDVQVEAFPDQIHGPVQ